MTAKRQPKTVSPRRRRYATEGRRFENGNRRKNLGAWQEGDAWWENGVRALEGC